MSKTMRLVVITSGVLWGMGVAEAFDMASPPDSLVVDESGAIGIGTATPADDVHIVNNDSGFTSVTIENTFATSGRNTQFVLKNTADGGSEWRFRNNTVGNFAITRPDQPGLQLVFDKFGNLRIQGSLTANAGTSNDTFPDYVFKPDYKLLPLDELSAYIERERHLPDIPTAEAVGKGGLNMTEMQIQLLKKVEELTLYTVQQHKTIEKLTERINTLEGAQRKAD